MPLLSDRAGKTSQVVMLPSSLEDPAKAPPGLLRLGVVIACSSITAFFAALVIAYYWRRMTPGFWNPIPLPGTLWLSTGIMLVSSVVFEVARRCYRYGLHAAAARLLRITACLGAAFLASQISSWRALVERGAFLAINPYSSFFYLFTGLHAAHLVGGLVALGFVILGRTTRRELVDVAAYYWHFLGVLWIALFVVLST
jgi:cytochrome c oxidase subunit III